MSAEFSHEITLALPVEEAFPLFTPKGEERWVPGWRGGCGSRAGGPAC
mgnify:CR=1 FL=1